MGKEYFMLSRKVSRLIHRLKISFGQSLRPLLNFLYQKKLGPASALQSVTLSCVKLKDKSSGCSFYPLLDYVPIPYLEPKYLISGEIERIYLERFKSSAIEGSKLSGKSGIIQLSDANVSMPSGIHLWEGKLFDEALLNPVLLTNPRYLIDLGLVPFKHKNIIKEPVVLLSMPWHHNFYHWMIEILPRLCLYSLDDKTAELPLIIPSSAPNFVKESLDLVGLSDKAFLLNDGVYTFQNLYLLTRLSPPSFPSPIAINWLNEKLSQSLGHHEVERKRLIYVSRSDAKYRYVTNEAEVEDYLSQFGFETIVMSRYSLQEKIKIFQEAHIVIGSSGAGFIGTAFMNPGTVFIEFFPEKHFADCFYHIASARQLKYGFLIGQRDGLGFSVDINQLSQIVSNIFSGAQFDKQDVLTKDVPTT